MIITPTGINICDASTLNEDVNWLKIICLKGFVF